MSEKALTEEMALEALKWIVHDVAARQTEAEQEKTDDFSKGRAQAYWEVMDMVKSRLEILGVQITDDQTKAAV